MEPPSTSVIGLSSLRPKDEPKKKKKPSKDADAKSKALQDYLAAAYGSTGDAGGERKKDKEDKKDKKDKKDKGKKKSKRVAGGLAIVDNDVDTTVQAVKELNGAHDKSDDEDAPVVVNEGEFRRLEIQEERQKELAERAGGWKVVEGDAHVGVGRVASGEDGEECDDGDEGASPPRRVRHDTDDDEESDVDASPPRRVRHDSDDDEDSDVDVRRKPSAEDSDASPPRRLIHDESDDGDDGDDGDDSDVDVPRRQGDRPTEMMSDGTLAGMVTGQELMKEMAEKRRRDIEKFEKLGDSVTGRHAKTVYRTDDGRAVSKEEFEQSVREKRQSEKGYVEGSELPWGKGLRQAKGAVADTDNQRNVPSRWDDPMGHILAKKKPGSKKKAGKSLLDTHAKELRKAGFNVPLEVPAHSWLNRNIAPPPNRFNIKPGRHWDGVDRGQGFEQFVVKTLAERRQKDLMGHFMAQEDM